MIPICVYFDWDGPGGGPNKIGDKIIISEFPENLHDIGYQFINKHNNPFLNYNPFVKEGTDVDLDINFSDINIKFIINPSNINSRTELLFNYLNLNTEKIKITKPRLYIHENNKKENIITIHTKAKEGTSYESEIPNNVIDHILTKYSKHYTIVQIIPPNYKNNGLQVRPNRIQGMTHLDYDINIKGSWERVAEMLSKSIMFIGVDSNVSHLAQAYMPNVNLFIPSGFINYFGNKSQSFGQGTIGNQWLHKNNYYFNEIERSYGFTNSYLTL